jgi:hypothetical protein
LPTAVRARGLAIRSATRGIFNALIPGAFPVIVAKVAASF